jgi:hypothetical protein
MPPCLVILWLRFILRRGISTSDTILVVGSRAEREMNRRSAIQAGCDHRASCWYYQHMSIKRVPALQIQFEPDY